MKNFRLTIEYDGARYHGWQRQKKDITIQATIEEALALITRQKISLIGSGRTDAGVHALGQVANFKCHTRLDADTFQKALNSLLPDDIVIKACHEMPLEFHARYDVKSKVYQYRIINRPLPSALMRCYTWHIRSPLNTGAINHALKGLLGCHDFKAFEATGSPRSHTRRTILRADWIVEKEDIHCFYIEADGFLRYMVRNLVGTLVDVGLNKKTVQAFQEILSSRNRSQAGATAPPQGLYLSQVKY